MQNVYVPNSATTLCQQTFVAMDKNTFVFHEATRHVALVAILGITILLSYLFLFISEVAETQFKIGCPKISSLVTWSYSLFWCWRLSIPALGVNTIPADAQAPKVARASAGMVLAG